MLSVTHSAATFGADGYEVIIECSARRSLPSFEIVGLPDAAIREYGTGKPAIKPMKFSSSVLPSAMEKSGIFMTNLKLSRPIHLLAHMPLTGLKRVNAIPTPTMGL